MEPRPSLLTNACKFNGVNLAREDPFVEASGEAERQYRFFAETLASIAWTASPEGAFEYCNQRCFDYSGATFTQTARAGYDSFVHPEAREHYALSWTAALDVGTQFEFEHRLKRASDGAYRWHFSRASPLRDAAGRILRWFGSSTDIDDSKRVSQSDERIGLQLRLNVVEITARKRAEAALRASGATRAASCFAKSRSTPRSDSLMALDGSFIRVNPALCTLTGYSEDELLASGHPKLAHPEESDAIAVHLDTTLEGVAMAPSFGVR